MTEHKILYPPGTLVVYKEWLAMVLDNDKSEFYLATDSEGRHRHEMVRLMFDASWAVEKGTGYDYHFVPLELL